MAMQLRFSSSSTSSFISNDFTYDVFISFRGTDTRFGFTGNLYKALCDKGINTFIDDKELKKGDDITPSLLKSIEDSRIAIIVFSKDYASSSFCLDELSHIIHCSNEKGSTVIPVFYGTEPTNVRKLNDSYGEALAKHEEQFQNNKENMERLLKWKKALNQAANLSGHHFNLGNEYERDFIEKIVTDVSNKINHVPLHVADYLVGLKCRISKVNSLLDLGHNDGVCIIGILGTGGMGKTTLAQAVYNLIANQFECKCLLHNVRENSVKHGLVYLQEQLLYKSIGFKTQLGHVNEGIPIIKQRLCKKKVLLILDDVDKREQLNNLVGEPSRLGPGSRVIITTRDKQLLSGHQIERIYEAGGLNKEEALELLRKVAFKNNKNDSRYDYILYRAVEYASGLPLALEVVGSNLYGKSIEECESLLDKYDRIPHEDIQKILKVSYDALDEEQQSVFLDIACVFKGRGEEYVQQVLHDHYGYSIKSHIGVLVDKSLIKISWCNSSCMNKVTLHDLIEDMGKEVVRQESPKEPGERSRLWCQDDIVHVLKENTGTSKIEMIHINFHSMESVIDQKGKAFKKMKKLKTLIIENGNFSEGLKYLPSSLITLKWKGCISESLSSTILSKKFQNMKVLTLDGSDHLTHIPDVSGLQHLEKLSFACCKNLITIHNSVGHLNKLEILDAGGCIKLECFPPLLLPSLKKLGLSDCESLNSFPEILCKMTNIKDISVINSSIGELPSSFQNLGELRSLRFWTCGMLRFSKHNDKMFSNVTELILNDCNLIDECVSILLKWCVNVELLDLWNNNFKILPECLSECHHLVKIIVDSCKSLEEIRGFPPNLREFSAVGCKSLSSSSRTMLMSQKLHEAGDTYFYFPNRREGIPDWFEYQSRGHTFSFWFRKEIPSITCIFILPEGNNWSAGTDVNYFVNGYEIEINICPFRHVYWNYTTLFYMKLNELCKGQRMYNMDKGLLKNEWIHVEFKLESYYWNAQMGIHVWNEKSNTEEENVVFTHPYINY